MIKPNVFPGSKAGLLLMTTVTALLQNAAFSSTEIPEFPTKRFIPWGQLNWVEQHDARFLLYTSESWNSFLVADIERLSYKHVAEALGSTDEVTSEGLKRAHNALWHIAIDQLTWDCWINHYIGNSWEELVDEHNVSWAFEALGWSEYTWGSENPDDWPESEEKQYNELTPAERHAADRICLPQQLWDGVPLTHWNFVDGRSDVELTYEENYINPRIDVIHNIEAAEEDVDIVPVAAAETITEHPSGVPSAAPTKNPSMRPTLRPTFSPTPSPSVTPSVVPTESPSYHPSLRPTVSPSSPPSDGPSLQPSSVPTASPSARPTAFPSALPSDGPSLQPSAGPTSSPSSLPSDGPSMEPSTAPTSTPSTSPSASPSALPSDGPSLEPTTVPSSTPSVYPSDGPSMEPSTEPTIFYEMEPQNCATNFTLVLVTDKYPKETSWSLTYEANGMVIGEGSKYKNDFEEHEESVCIRYDACYMFQINDKWDDGICCSNGQGSYSGYLDKEGMESLPIPGLNGGAFETTRRHKFCLDENGDLVEGLGSAIGVRFNGA